MRNKVWIHGFKGLIITGLAVALVSCAGEAPTGKMTPAKSSAAVTNAGKMGALLKVLVTRAPTVKNFKKANPGKLLNVKAGKFAGTPQVLVDVLIKGDKAAIPKLKAMGIGVRTVTKNGIMTATAPLNKVKAIAALADVTRIEAGKRMRTYNDLSNGFATAAAGDYGMNTDRTYDGAGVVVGVIDTGIDWTHGDFIKNDGDGDPTNNVTRIKYYWDQSDTADDNAPAGFTYGHEYTETEINAYLAGNTSAVKKEAKDIDGHGTHVAGTAAGDGSESGGQYMGVAPAADIVFVKFDFDGDRNSDAAIIDGVNYIFQKAAELGKPAVINMSLGTDFGPHDGTTLEELGIDGLTGTGKIVVVAAGNPGSNNWSDKLTWGYAMHGKAELGQEAVFTFSPYIDSPEDYIFLDLWYPGTAPNGQPNNCRVFITTPGGTTYPTSTVGRSRKTWTTGSNMTGYDTLEGSLIVGNGGDQFDWGTENGDHEVYIEISDWFDPTRNPAVGEFVIKLEPTETGGTCEGTFHVWYGASSSVINGWKDAPTPVPPTFNGNQSDNAYTIGSPASANNVIAVAAYQSRNAWNYVYGTTCATETTPGTQDYSTYPIDYYDGYAIGQLAYFSGRGPRRDGVLKPEIATPGVGIISAFSSHVAELVAEGEKCADYWTGGEYHYGTNRVLPGEKYNVLQGTSMACPNGTGAIALLLQKDETLTAAALRGYFATTAHKDNAVTKFDWDQDAGTDTDCGVLQPGVTCLDLDGDGFFQDPDQWANNDWGYGKMDIAATLAAITAPAPVSCGDGMCNGDETCSTCPQDCGECPADPYCGDGAVNGEEDCEGTNLNDTTCADLEGFSGGDLDCTAACTFDTSGCTSCLTAGEHCTSDAECCDNLTCQAVGKSGKFVCK